MSTPVMSPAAVPNSVKDLLMPGRDIPPELSQAVGTVAQSSGLGDALSKLTPLGLDILGKRIGALLGDMLNVDLGGMLGGALMKNEELADALRATAETPGSEAIVTLADQTLQSGYSPAVDIVVNEVPLVSVAFDVSLATLIEGALVVVRDGRMTAVQAGRAHLTASLSCQGTPIAAREVELNLPAVLRLPEAVAGGAGTAVGAVSAAAGVAGVQAAPEAGGPGAGVPGAAVPGTRAPGAAGPAPGAAVPGAATGAGAAGAGAPEAEVLAASASVVPPVGLIANGWRFTAAGAWEPATQALPGDIVNGHRLNADGTAWEPLPPE
ncbi:hypothetical protein P0L94_10445 [Microbacter sp. GSS18]|nr:hypothetical protein P0L94_10445 [Microbacter sp. GSS18]